MSSKQEALGSTPSTGRKERVGGWGEGRKEWGVGEEEGRKRFDLPESSQVSLRVSPKCGWKADIEILQCYFETNLIE